MPSPVEFIRKEVEEKLPLWERIRAACEGQDAVKKLKEKVLPTPTPGDITPEASARYKGYLQRAVFYNVSGRTLEGMAGYVFAKDPAVTLPSDITTMEENVDGNGVTLDQQAKTALRSILSLGRCGLLVDYPTVNGRVTTKQDVLDGKIAPIIQLYAPEDIINWRTETYGAETDLVMLVLRECYTETGANEFELTDCPQYRVLTKDEKGVHGRIFRKVGESDLFEPVADLAYEVVGKDGQPLDDIPFFFLGAVNNDASIDTPPLQDLVNLNLAHFCNSADYEEACFLVGQPTPWASGLTQQWVDEVMKGKFILGSRACIPLPENGACGLLQADPNTMPGEAMKHKEEQMLAIGAKLIQTDQPNQKTATEVGLQHASEVSVLTAAAMNVFSGYRAALNCALLFVGSGEAKIEYDLAEPLTEDTISADVATALVAVWTVGLIDDEEARRQLRKPGWAFKDDDVVAEATAAKGMLRPPAPPAPGKPPVKPPAPLPPGKPIPVPKK